jgi:hypothetical protein
MSHIEQFEHNPGDHDDPKADSTWVIGIGGVIVLIVLIVAITVLYYKTDEEFIIERVVNETPAEIRKLRSAQEHDLLTYGTLPTMDAEGNPLKDAAGNPVSHVHIPISRAMELLVAESGGGSKPTP